MFSHSPCLYIVCWLYLIFKPLVFALFSWAFHWCRFESSRPRYFLSLACIPSPAARERLGAWVEGWETDHCPWGPMGMENLWTSPDFERIDHLNKKKYFNMITWWCWTSSCNISSCKLIWSRNPGFCIDIIGRGSCSATLNPQPTVWLHSATSQGWVAIEGLPWELEYIPCRSTCLSQGLGLFKYVIVLFWQWQQRTCSQMLEGEDFWCFESDCDE